MKAAIVIASSENNCIGINNSLPWNLPKDLKRFKSITSAHEHSIVIMGRKTYESIGKPLPGRINYVITKDLKASKNISANIFPSIEKAMEDILHWECFLGIEYNVFFIGGVGIFKESIENKYVDTIYHTLVHSNIDGDTFIEMPSWNVSKSEIIAADEKNKFDMSFRILTRP